MPAKMVGEVLSFSAYMCSLPQHFERYSQAEFCIVRAPADAPLIERLKLNWNSKKLQMPGFEVIEITAKLKRPRSTVNFSAAPYEKYLFYKRIHALGTVLSFGHSHGSYTRVALSLTEKLKRDFLELRYQYWNYLDRFLTESAHPGVIKALLTGVKYDLSDRESLLMKDTNTLHLVAISGLHVGLFMFAIYNILPKRKAFLLLSVILGLCYVALVGFSESAQRAWVMVSIALLVVSGYKPMSKGAVYMLAMTAVLLIDPLAALNSGFWYSFIAVAILIFLVSQLNISSKQPLKAMIAAQLSLTIGLFFVNLSMGIVTGFASIFANLIAVPWVTLVLLPMCIFSLVLAGLNSELGEIAFYISDLLAQVLIEYLDALQFLDEKIIWPPTFNTLAAFWVFCSVFYLFILKRYAAPLVVALVLCLLLPSSRVSSREFIVLDVGQGLSLLMIWDGQFWVYDTAAQKGQFSPIDTALVPYVYSSGVEEAFSGLVVSHGDDDHAGGVNRLLQRFEPAVMLSGESDRLLLKQGFERRLRACYEGMTWANGAGTLEVLFPAKGDNIEVLSSNNHSCVLRFTLDGIVFLLMGDLEKEAEKRLVSRYLGKLKADVLIAGHHGSGNASSLTLLKHVRPTYIVISAGYQNRFGHPHAELQHRADLVGAEILSTVDSGAIKFDLNDGLNFSYAREKAYFWLD